MYEFVTLLKILVLLDIIAIIGLLCAEKFKEKKDGIY